MRHISPIYFLAFVVLSFAACTREEVALTPDDVNARVDSIVRMQTEFVKQRAAEDLDRRQAIEVKVKTDSILEARANGGQPKPPPPPNREP